MPTARELLEQADALMRRNRSGRVDTDATPPPSITTDLGLPEPPPAGLPAAEPTPSTDAPPAAQAVSLEDIPVLTDAVEEIEAPTIQDATWDAGEATDWGEFDIIEEIEAPSILDLPEDGGEPSGWGTYDGGEPTVGGAAPDSLIVVPPVTYFRDGEVHRGVAFGARARAEAAADTERDDDPGASGVLVVDQSLVSAGLLATEGAGEPLVAAVASSAEMPVPAATIALTDPAASIFTEVAVDDGIVTLYDALSADEAAAIAVLAAQPTARAAAIGEPVTTLYHEPEADAPSPVDAARSAAGTVAADTLAVEPDVAAAPATPDRARWDALAEDIRMQVLQRIDMFTDAGMQDQLRARLQPIVDRASADLVDTINQHVGQLLRSYVAEAIEREIENWRNDH
jgi:hypothetical protein